MAAKSKLLNKSSGLSRTIDLGLGMIVVANLLTNVPQTHLPSLYYRCFNLIVLPHNGTLLGIIVSYRLLEDQSVSVQILDTAFLVVNQRCRLDRLLQTVRDVCDVIWSDREDQRGQPQMPPVEVEQRVCAVSAVTDQNRQAELATLSHLEQIVILPYCRSTHARQVASTSSRLGFPIAMPAIKTTVALFFGSSISVNLVPAAVDRMLSIKPCGKLMRPGLDSGPRSHLRAEGQIELMKSTSGGLGRCFYGALHLLVRGKLAVKHHPEVLISSLGLQLDVCRGNKHIGAGFTIRQPDKEGVGRFLSNFIGYFFCSRISSDIVLCGWCLARLAVGFDRRSRHLGHAFEGIYNLFSFPDLNGGRQRRFFSPYCTQMRNSNRQDADAPRPDELWPRQSPLSLQRRNMALSGHQPALLRQKGYPEPHGEKGAWKIHHHNLLSIKPPITIISVILLGYQAKAVTINCLCKSEPSQESQGRRLVNKAICSFITQSPLNGRTRGYQCIHAKNAVNARYCIFSIVECNGN
ncbi:hypothetical protein J6590_067269 [Homalodisca vitripennis]|nr:hypothetical protein J6590_067269 [Homalodisca vitripennis]